MAGISVSYLAIRFKKETGQSVMEYINKARHGREKVSRGLRYARGCGRRNRWGIGNRNYFTKLFKKYEKCTPREYRDMMQAKHG